MRILLGIIFGILLAPGIALATAPTIDSLTTAISSGGTDQYIVNLVANSTVMIYFHGSATDAEGCETINLVSGTWVGRVYRTDVVNSYNCAADNNNCYPIGEGNITITGCTGTPDIDLNYEATASLQYYSDATDAGSPNANTDWTVRLEVTDSSSQSGNRTDTFEVASLNGLEVSASISYGSLNLGQESSQQTVTITNAGNRSIDADIRADGALTCSGVGSGNIPAGQVKASLNSGFNWSDTEGIITLSTTNQTLDLNLGARTDDATPSTMNSYLKIKIPSDNISGACQNNLIFTAKAT